MELHCAEDAALVAVLLLDTPLHRIRVLPQLERAIACNKKTNRGDAGVGWGGGGGIGREYWGEESMQQ